MSKYINQGSASDAFERIIFNHIFRSASITGSVCYMALYTSEPTDADTGAEVPLTYGYARQDMSNKWGVNTTTGSAWNTYTFTFPTATGSWGNVKYWGIKNGSEVGSNTGSLLIWGEVEGIEEGSPSGRYVDTGEAFRFAAYHLGAVLTGSLTPLTSASILKHYLNNSIWKMSGSSVYLGLYDLPVTGGSAELSGSGYRRIPAGGSGSWTFEQSLTTGSFTNAVPLIFSIGVPSMWTTIYGAFFTAGSETLFRLPFPSVKSVPQGTGFMFNTGFIKVRID